MEGVPVWHILAGVVITYYCTLTYYRLFLHPLSQFPGPRLAAISRWYEAYYDVFLGGQYTKKIAELHTRYGSVVRISPYELHVMDPTFFETLYRLDGRWHKYAWTYDAFGAPKSTLFGSDHDAHKVHRGAIAPFFSKANIIARQDVLQRNVDRLSQRIHHQNSNTFNLGAALSAFTRDTANEFIVGKQYDELGAQDFGIGLSVASQGAGVFWRTTKHVRWFGPMLKSIPIGWLEKIADDGTQSFLQYLKKSEQDTRETLRNAGSSSPSNLRGYPTMVHAIVHSDLPSFDKQFERVLDEVATVTGAAFETTANVLRLITYHIYNSSEILERLRTEIATVPCSPPELPSIKQLEQLKYLTAVLKEGLRLSPAVASRAARVTDKDLFYNNWRIPAGTPVGMTTILLHTDEKQYRNPMRFYPDRWLDSTADTPTTSVFAPFSRGTRMCLGMHMAWAEMYLIVAALVQRFDFTIQGATDGDFELQQDNFGIGTKAGCNLTVRATAYRPQM